MVLIISPASVQTTGPDGTRLAQAAAEHGSDSILHPPDSTHVAIGPSGESSALLELKGKPHGFDCPGTVSGMYRKK